MGTNSYIHHHIAHFQCENLLFIEFEKLHIYLLRCVTHNESKNLPSQKMKNKTHSNGLLLNKASRNRSAMHLKAMIFFPLFLFIIEKRVEKKKHRIVNNSNINGKSLEESLLNRRAECAHCYGR